LELDVRSEHMPVLREFWVDAAQSARMAAVRLLLSNVVSGPESAN
jgi:hypothetical protein